MTLINRASAVSVLILLSISLSIVSIILTTTGHFIPSKTVSDQPDSIVENVVSTTFDKTGKPVFKISTPKITHYPDESTDIISPEVTLFREPNTIWHINSKTAHATSGTDQITFKDNVVVRHQSDLQKPVTTLYTTSLTVFTDKKIAKTDDPVFITDTDTKIHAIGMLAHLDDGTIKLLSKADLEYVPTAS